MDYGSGPVSMGSGSNSFFNDSHFSTNYSADTADRIFGVPARQIDDNFEVDSRLSLGAFDTSGGSINPYGKVGVRRHSSKFRKKQVSSVPYAKDDCRPKILNMSML